MESRREEKMIKTGIVLGAMNVVSWLFLGKLTTAALDVLVLYYFHELGKSRRTGANMYTKGLSIFNSYAPKEANIQTNELSNIFSNIINGGDVIADEGARLVEKYKTNKP